MDWVDSSQQIPKEFHAFDHRDGFVRIKVDVLMECELSVEYEP